jgi:hyaluronoglucosaminidase
LLGSIEGYYGIPFSHAARRDHMSWMATKGLDLFAYAPKDDPYHRDKWREMHPTEDMDAFADLIAHGRSVGVDFCYTISPGLDWSAGDEDALIAKLRSLRSIGCDAMAILWDDVPSGGTELGETHGRANAAAAKAIDGVRWWTVGTDYAVGEATPYLEALCRETPGDMLVAWTGPYVVPLDVDADLAAKIGEAVGRKLLLWENFPVNDGAMAGVLHMGPYPERDAALPGVSSGVLLNTMQQPIASRIGIACGATFWQDPTSDREAAWRSALGEIPGIEAFARASRSWVSHPGPSDELIALMERGDLRAYLEGGVRNGLGSDVTAEIEPWLQAWEREAQAMLMGLDILDRGYRSGPRGMAGGVLWTRARLSEQQVFGIRQAVYPVFQQRGKESTAHNASTVVGNNLTDIVMRRALQRDV